MNPNIEKDPCIVTKPICSNMRSSFDEITGKPKPGTVEELQKAECNVAAVLSYFRYYYLHEDNEEYARRCDAAAENPKSQESLLLYNEILGLFATSSYLFLFVSAYVCEIPAIVAPDTKELGGWFTGPSDFFKTASGVVLLPKPRYCTEDFLDQVSSGRKKFILSTHVLRVRVPKFPEFNADNCYKAWCTFPDFAFVLPDSKKRIRNVDRDFFFNVVNTMYPGVIQELVDKAKTKRVERQVPTRIASDIVPHIFTGLLSMFTKLPADKKSSFLPKKVRLMTVVENYSVTVNRKGLNFTIEYKDGVAPLVHVPAPPNAAPPPVPIHAGGNQQHA